MSDINRILSEIVDRLEIGSDLTFSHPDYPQMELPAGTAERFALTSSQLQIKYTIARLQTYLHDIYFNHSLPTHAETERLQSVPVGNNISDGIDLDFTSQLHQGNTGRGYFDADWQIVASTPDGELVVVKDGLYLHVRPDFHLPPNVADWRVGDLVPILLPPSLMGRDTYIMVGNAGTPLQAPNAPPSLRVYFNCTPAGAVTISQMLTDYLNQLGIAFQVAILHNPQYFHRYDSVTLWLQQTDYPLASSAIDRAYRSQSGEFTPATPIFAKQLAPGLAIAEEPPTGSFGSHRCELVAAGLIAAYQQGETSSIAKLAAIAERFESSGVDLESPHLNPARSDVYSMPIL